MIIAEPKAHIGFAGPQVIEQTIRQKLPDGFQTADFLMEKGQIDMVVPRAELPAVLKKLLGYHVKPPAPAQTGVAPKSGPQESTQTRSAWACACVVPDLRRATAYSPG